VLEIGDLLLMGRGASAAAYSRHNSYCSRLQRCLRPRVRFSRQAHPSGEVRCSGP